MRRGVDFAYGTPGQDGAALAAEGLFVGRYVPYLGDQGKGLRADELADYRAHGVDLFLFFQTTADFMRGGFAHGALHAQWCLAACANLGLDDSGAFYFACDFDIQPAEYSIVADYLRGVASVLPKRRIGFYGHDRICTHIFGLGLAHYFCQCVAWSGGRVFGNRNLYQATPGQPWNGHDACREEAYTDDFGQWRATPVQVNTPDNEMRRAVFAGPGSAHQDDPDGGLGYANYRLGLRLTPQAPDAATGIESWVGGLALAVRDLTQWMRDNGTTDARFAEIEDRLTAAANALAGPTGGKP